MNLRKNGKLRNRLKFIGPVLIVVSVAAVGTFLVVRSRAATPAIAAEAEQVTASSGVSIVSDPGASSGKALKFNANSTGVRNIKAKGVGISGNFMSMTPAEQDATFADFKSLGLTWIRIDISWAYVQPTQSSAYRWTAYDAVIEKARAHGLQVDGILDYTTPWNRTAGCATNLCQPADTGAYVAFAKAAVSHFGYKLGAVEIWNEPNIINFWRNGPNASAYTNLLKQTYAGIKAVDPNMLVISGGLSPSSQTNANYIQAVEYTAGMYANGAKGSFDVFGYHPYTHPKPPSQYYSYSGWSMMNETPKSVRSVMAANGDSDKPIWLTEMGAPTNGPGPKVTCAQAAARTYPGGNVHVDSCMQAQIISEAVTKAKSYPWVGVTFIYTYKDLGTATNTNENFFGIVDTTGARKPAYEALKAAIKQ